jgi:hypothetical protein
MPGFGFTREGAEALAALASKELARISDRDARYGAEPPIGSVIRWRKQFGDGKTYMYAAIRTELGWYTTGPRSPKGYSWETLIEFIDLPRASVSDFAILATGFPTAADADLAKQIEALKREVRRDPWITGEMQEPISTPRVDWDPNPAIFEGGVPADPEEDYRHAHKLARRDELPIEDDAGAED